MAYTIAITPTAYAVTEAGSAFILLGICIVVSIILAAMHKEKGMRGHR